MKPKVIVIVGPTASGKTALSIELAKKIDGEIISCDSMQIYKDMNIGSAKPTIEEMQGIKHYMIDIAEPTERFSVAEYKKRSEEAIEKILQKGKVPIIVGGTGLYANSLIYNIEYNEIMLDEEYRKNLMKIAETEVGLATLYEKARIIDPVAMEKISSNDKKRIIRVLEIKHSTGKNKTELELESRKNEVKYEYKVFAINMPREILYDRINKRVDIMIENGLIDEVENIIEKYKEFPTAMQAIGYKEIVMYLKGELTKQEAIEKIKQESRRYAKRQITWFKKIENIKWIDGLKDKDENIKFIQDVIFALKKECD
jgi:tRNA dimethylallyltransferase